jgi:N-acetyl-anhydromuramyl-L-alanine amidase AmpD
MSLFPFYWPWKKNWRFYENTPKYIKVVPPEIKITSNMWTDLKPIELHKIKVVAFPEKEYSKEEFTKKQIVIHHTVSGNGVDGDISTWEADPAVVGTAMIIDRDGTPYQLFSSKYWAWHLGIGKKSIDSTSIGIEIDNWGWLVPGDGTVKKFGNPSKSVKTEVGKYYTYYGKPVVVPMQYYEKPFRGYNYYEKYTLEQIRTVGELILFWKDKYNISVKYNADMWDVNPKALNGENGVWTHVSYRPDKSDCHPQPELMEMLKTLSTL